MQKALISVIVPIYNVEKYLEKCIESIINQTYRNLEIILVDDGSLDNSGAICDEYAKRDKRIRVIHKENGGLSDARNAGINVAKGEYIGFIDGDDYIDVSMYEKLIEALIANNTDMSICNFRYVDEKGEKVAKEEFPIQNSVVEGNDILKKDMFENNYWYWVVAWNKLYKKEIFEKLRFPKGKVHEDEFIIHHVLYNRTLVGISDCLINYVQRSGSIMSNNSNIKIFDKAEAIINRANFYIENNIDNILIYRTLMSAITTLADQYYICNNNLKKNRYKSIKETINNTNKKYNMNGLSLKYKMNLILSSRFPIIVYRVKRIVKTNRRNKNNE